MSVPKSLRGESKLEVFVKAEKLACYTLHICNNENHFPKRYRWCLTSKIIDSVLEIHCLITKAMLRKKIRDDWAYEQIAHIVDSFKGEKGIGLGSQVSQLIQLAVLDDLDHIIKERFKIKQYIRFMDDFILIHEDKNHLAMIRTFIEDYLTNLGLILSKKKTMLQKLSQPFHFMGFSYRLTETGKIIRKILKPKIKHEKRKYKGLLKQVANKKMSPKQLNECLTAWRAHARKGNTHNLILKIDKYFKERKLNYGTLS